MDYYTVLIYVFFCHVIAIPHQESTAFPLGLSSRFPTCPRDSFPASPGYLLIFVLPSNSRFSSLLSSVSEMDMKKIQFYEPTCFGLIWEIPNNVNGIINLKK